MTNLTATPATAPSQSAPPPILLAEPLAPSQTPILMVREQGQLVDLSKTIGTAKLIRDGDELHILDGNGQIVVIEQFFGGPANEFFILMPSGPLTTQSQFLKVVEVETAPRLGSFQVDLPSPAQKETEDADKSSEETSWQPISKTSLQNVHHEPALEKLNSLTQSDQLSENTQDNYQAAPLVSALNTQSENIIVPRLSVSDLYVQPNSTVTRASDLPVHSVQEASFRTSTSISVSDSLALDFGVDGTNSRALLFTLDAAGRPLGRSGDPLDITCGGARVLFQSEFGPQGQHILKGLKGDGTLVLKVTLDPNTPNGAYSYEQFAPLDHTGSALDLLMSFRFIAKDADGDTLVSHLDIRVEDDPMPTEWNLTATVSEAGLPGGSEGDPAEATASGVLPINASQGPVVLSWNTASPVEGFSFHQEGQTLLILQGNKVVLSVTLNSATGTYSVTQHSAINHGADADAVFNLSFSATNTQGQTTEGKLLVSSLDDAPKAFPLNQISFDESQLSTQTELSYSSEYLPHSAGADTATISWQLPDDPEGLIYIIEGQQLSVLQGDTLILTAQFTESKGAYAVQQHNPLQHQNGVDQQTISLPYVITDGDGDTAAGHFQVSIKDDNPEVGEPVHLNLSDDALASTGAAHALAEDTHALTGVLPISTGVDGGQVSWTQSALPSGFSWDLNGEKLTLFQNTTAIFTATLNSSSGAYSVDQHAPLNHARGIEQFQLHYVASDADGDSVNGQLQITITDSTPVLSSAPEALSLSENALFEARMNDKASIVQSGDLNIHWGADTQSAPTLTFSSSMSGSLAPFTVNGAQVYYSIEGTGNQLSAKTQDGTLVFTIKLDPTGSGNYEVEFFTPIDHTSASEVSLPFSAVASDGDGDTIPLDFTFSILDGKSSASPDQFSGTEDTPLVLDLLGNDTLSSEGFTVRIVLAPAKGHLSQNPDNTFSYTGHPNANGSDSFSYYIEDADGERSDTVTVSIELSPENDAPIFSGVGQDTPLHMNVEDDGPDTVFTANASDADGDPLHFFLEGSDKARFNIDEQTGQISWKEDVSFEAPMDLDGDNIYEITVVAKDSSGAEAAQQFRIEVSEGTSAPAAPPTIFLHTREPGSYQVSWTFDETSYSSELMGQIQSTSWAESGDDGEAKDASDGSSDIYIDADTGELVLSDRSGSSSEGDDNLACISKTFDLTGAQSASIQLTYAAEFATNGPAKSFYIEALLADGSVHQIGEISSLISHTQSQTINLDLSDYISSATTIRLVAPADLTAADTLRIEELTVSIVQPEPLEQQHFEASFQLGDDDLAIAKSAKIDGVQDEISGLTLKLFNAQNGDHLNFLDVDGVQSQLEDNVSGVMTLTFSGITDASTYQNLLNSITFTTTSESLQARSLSVVVHSEDGNSNPSITSIQVHPNPDDGSTDARNQLDGTAGDDILKSTDEDDVINGFEGNDQLTAGAGSDELTGGEGSDIFFFEQLDGAADHITDFQLKTSAGGDRDILDLSKLLDDYGEGGTSQYYNFTNQYVRIVENQDGQYAVQVDLDARDDDQTWETVTTLDFQNADAVGATLSVDVKGYMPEVELPIEYAFPMS
ncbi:Ig-like domain-containing protein [Pseudovibrio sp. Alg231-02]|uniref:Ig-like domain-containing protein n=1 Tax=Pseudovibrio sp. Alg231-02 TaxID=1922223 RepID=UPI000D54DE2B|nr:Ig-like domain-containing protein [Pseudovibrio sp. Alg231-02]